MAEEHNYETPEMRWHRLISPGDQRSDPAFAGQESDLPAYPPGHDENCPVCNKKAGKKEKADEVAADVRTDAAPAGISVGSR